MSINSENDSATKFAGGLALSEAYYFELVKPLLAAEYADLSYSAALIGNGSEVLGFDTEMSSDHCWGPRLLLFLEKDDFFKRKDELNSFLEAKLPSSYKGYATHFDAPPNLPEVKNYGIVFLTIESFIQKQLEFPFREGQELNPVDWLKFQEYQLATIAGGKVFHDGLKLESVRAQFHYYPQDVWLYLMASFWLHIEEEEHLMGRAGFVGDEVGSALIAARLVRSLMRLCFLMERQYAPYAKWFGTAFSKLKSADKLEPVFRLVLSSSSWRERQRWLCEAYKLIAGMQNSLAIIEPMRTAPIQFHDRPFLVISMGRFSQAISEKISDATLRSLLSKPVVVHL